MTGTMDCAASEFAVQENGEWYYDYRQLKDGKKKDPNGKKLTAAEMFAFHIHCAFAAKLHRNVFLFRQSR